MSEIFHEVCVHLSKPFTSLTFNLKFTVNILFWFSSLRVAELVWMEGVMIKEFPPEAFTIKCLDDAMDLLNTDDGQKRFEGHLKAWMKKIQVY